MKNDERTKMRKLMHEFMLERDPKIARQKLAKIKELGRTKVEGENKTTKN